MGVVSYGFSIVTMGAILSIAAMAVNIMYAHTGLFNIGLNGWIMIGGYMTAIISGGPGLGIGGFGMPFIVGWVVAVAVAGIVGYFLGRAIIGLEFGFFAIGTIGLAEAIKIIFKNEDWLAGATRGKGNIPNPVGFLNPSQADIAYAILALVVMILVYYFVTRRLTRSPWGRVQVGIKSDDVLTNMLGKDTTREKVISFTIGSAMLGFAGAMYAHYVGYVNPRTFDAIMWCFLIWAMMLVGGMGSNKGVIVGSFLLWSIYSLTIYLAGFLPLTTSQVLYLRVLFVGLAIILFLQFLPEGIIPRKRVISASAKT